MNILESRLGGEKIKAVFIVFAGLAIAALILVGGKAEDDADNEYYYKVAKRQDVSSDEAIRISLRVVTDYPISEDGIRRITEELLSEEKAKGEFNAFGIFFYDHKALIHGDFSLAKAEYVPHGEWAEAESVQVGDYSSHKLVYDFRSKVAEPDNLQWDRPGEDSFEICGAFYGVLMEEPHGGADMRVIMNDVAENMNISHDEVEGALYECTTWREL